ncbi:MAG: cell division protein FtsL [Lachnospiraceae bacterium]|nr:cell division protein FtsL [Lachnospiraceae bacterium]
MSTHGRKNTYYADSNHRNTGNLTEGNVVRKIKPAAPAPARITVVPRKPKKKSVRHLKNRDKARYMDLGYVLFLVCALVVSAFTLYNYLGLQSEITNSVKQIASLERELNNLRLANEENHSRIINNVDLDYIRQIAIQELGMIYPIEGQILEFAGNNTDFVRQLNPLP